MSSTCYVKVYYTKQQQQPEIRRFAIDISPNNDIYQELCTKIATYQPDIQLNGFTLQYIDEENERITFSSNDELRSAISSNKDSNALKIFVTINQSTNQQETPINKECHPGVECDNCKGSIIGFRYKCVICPNYDLCEKCSLSGIHSEHNMIKISKPGNFYHPYGSRNSNRRYRHTLPPPFIPNTEFFEQIQTQIPQWLPNRENTAHFRTHMQQQFDNIKSNTQTHMQNSKQYLESVGQYLQQTLSPFGIDCDYRVDENTSSTTNTRQGTSTNETTVPSEPSTVPRNSNTNNQQQQQQQQQGGISSWLNMFRPNGTNSSTASANNSNNTSQTSPSLEKAVEDCVEKMKAMGFDDTDENLLQLIRSKNGDLISVLDEMNTRLNEN
ncbi:unnamed protein product [Rotaria sp. Silwood2]|nr:unnamed protein product [Rotaria sp. Silwood2]CAF2819277.1 unnamed protein product [Rotaria sp. Silwood2]CAF2980235.1 unnamed protein product [Rotaria sp. Silwood2]CAF4113950.1 unnamed protein product [Rotaria sp. Silwood2]CAF4150050.1 unnamed protein product [Rotaria sp. Silwood2]